MIAYNIVVVCDRLLPLVSSSRGYSGNNNLNPAHHIAVHHYQQQSNGSSLLHRLDSSSCRHAYDVVVVHGDDADVEDEDGAASIASLDGTCHSYERSNGIKVVSDSSHALFCSSIDGQLMLFLETNKTISDSFISIKFEDNGKATWVDTQSVQKAAAKITDEALTEELTKE